MAKRWTAGEDKLLKELGDHPKYFKAKRTEGMDWQKIATEINRRYSNNRTAAACQNRWLNFNEHR